MVLISKRVGVHIRTHYRLEQFLTLRSAKIVAPCSSHCQNPVSPDSRVPEPLQAVHLVLHSGVVRNQSINLRFQFRLHPKGWLPSKYKFLVQSKEDFAYESNKCLNDQQLPSVKSAKKSRVN